MAKGNEYLDQDVSDISDAESGYDSEAAEVSKTERRGTKRRKLSHSSDGVSSNDEADEDEDEQFSSAKEQQSPVKKVDQRAKKSQAKEDDVTDEQGQEIDYKIKQAPTALSNKSRKSKKEKTPGVVYLSSLPPYLKPSALRNILAQRGFDPITRLFLTPASKHKHGSKKSSRQLYTEGWIEFASKKTAKRCAEALNAQLVGGKKGGFYYDDLWNMRYLKGMAWDELMAGIREERREEEGRRDEERRRIAVETRTYVEGVERGKRMEGMKRKRGKQRQEKGGDDDVGGEDGHFMWRQHEVVKGGDEKGKPRKLDSETQQVLNKIF